MNIRKRFYAKSNRLTLLLSFTLAGCTSPLSTLNFPQVLSSPIFPGSQINASSNSAQSPSSEQLKLGMLLSLSGDLAKQSSSMRDSARLMIETVNDCKGVVGQAVQLFAEDDQGTAGGGKVGMTRLVADDRVGAVIGAIGSEVSNAAVNIAVEQQIVQISPASANSIFTERAKKGELQGFWYRTMPPDMAQGEAIAYLAQQRGFKKVSIVAIDNDYGNSITRAFETNFKQLGGTVVGSTIRYSPAASVDDVNWISAFTSEADAVLIVAEPNLGSAMLKSAADLGYWSGNTKVLLTTSMKTDTLASQVGQSIDGRYIASGVIGITYKTTSPVFTQFRDLYKKQYDREPSLYDANTWDAAALAMLAAEAAGHTTGTAIKSQIMKVANPPGIEVSDICQALSLVRDGKDINYQGASGTVDLTPAGDVVATYDVWTIDYMGKIKVESSIEAGRPQK